MKSGFKYYFSNLLSLSSLPCPGGNRHQYQTKFLLSDFQHEYPWSQPHFQLTSKLGLEILQRAEINEQFEKIWFYKIFKVKCKLNQK